jgi:hypothetical protein
MVDLIGVRSLNASRRKRLSSKSLENFARYCANAIALAACGMSIHICTSAWQPTSVMARRGVGWALARPTTIAISRRALKGRVNRALAHERR